MKYLNCNYHVKVKDKRYRIPPTENLILRLRKKPISLRTWYQVQNDTQSRKNQKLIRNDKDELIIKNCSKKNNRLFNNQNLNNHLFVLVVSKIFCFNLQKDVFVKVVSILSRNKSTNLIKNVLRQDHFFLLDYLILLKN